jgi:hypothetical protein
MGFISAMLLGAAAARKGFIYFSGGFEVIMPGIFVI